MAAQQIKQTLSKGRSYLEGGLVTRDALTGATGGALVGLVSQEGILRTAALSMLGGGVGSVLQVLGGRWLFPQSKVDQIVDSVAGPILNVAGQGAAAAAAAVGVPQAAFSSVGQMAGAALGEVSQTPQSIIQALFQQQAAQ